uniref:Uncharacterized protein n=1 Tax=Leersia perrieri TaxID=77586 RepID=A0A0D9VEQ7_9ORYZ
MKSTKLPKTNPAPSKRTNRSKGGIRSRSRSPSHEHHSLTKLLSLSRIFTLSPLAISAPLRSSPCYATKPTHSSPRDLLEEKLTTSPRQSPPTFLPDPSPRVASPANLMPAHAVVSQLRY